mmetsp:Transcript_17857/g.39972  ORF Transcript_17857/g.39972 Transcript_17857/m.39972 type:complete len:80 (+) Transcript_17857:145-384(+)
MVLMPDSNELQLALAATRPSQYMSAGTMRCLNSRLIHEGKRCGRAACVPDIRLLSAPPLIDHMASALANLHFGYNCARC